MTETPVDWDPPDRDPLGQRPLLGQRPHGQRPHGQRHPWTETSPWTETPLDRDPLDRDIPGQRPPDRDPPDRDPPWTETEIPLVNRQTHVKTQPSQTSFACGNTLVLNSTSRASTKNNVVLWSQVLSELHRNEINSIETFLRCCWYLLSKWFRYIKYSYLPSKTF